jgi:hypothetical protein
MAHPGRAGTGLWSCRREPARQSPPIRATIPCATASLAGRQVVPKGAALRPYARDFRWQGGLPVFIWCSVPLFLSGWKHADLRDPRGGEAGERWASSDGAGAPVLGQSPIPPLPFAVLGPIRLFDTQPQRGRLRERAALADSGSARTHEGDCRSGQTLRAPVARGMVLRPQRQEPTPCPRRMPPLTPPASPPR